ncbi:MAG: methylenetetrahydrofolate reductase [NAD(P)H] [Magnetococcales bacterium]|nr:methylenetetrahydrofolate reductase [NAD(P)H] [Magnetococcales bacterium]
MKSYAWQKPSYEVGNREGSRLSFEFFPPKDAEGEAQFWRSMEALAAFRPGFVSVTCGAGGGARQGTVPLVREVMRRTGLPVMAHLPGIGLTEEEVSGHLENYAQDGVPMILALRGDPPAGVSLSDGPFAHASDLVRFIRQRMPGFGVGVAAYPEVHPESPDAATDLAFFRLKVEAGAEVAITQFFFDNQSYFDFCDTCRRQGIMVPVIPGILPVTNYQRLESFAARCGARLPPWLVDRLIPIRDDPQAMLAAGIDIAVEQCRELLDRGAPGLHFFTLNRANSMVEILSRLGFEGN